MRSLSSLFPKTTKLCWFYLLNLLNLSTSLQTQYHGSLFVFRILLTNFLTNSLALFPQVISHIAGKAIIYKYNCTYVTFLPKALQWLPVPFG